MDKPSLETVCTAIDTLFHNQQVEGKDEASKWLDQFQHSVSFIIIESMENFILKGVDLIDHASIFLLHTINHCVVFVLSTYFHHT